MKPPRHLLCLLALLPASCASDSDATDHSKPQPRKSLVQRVHEKNGFSKDSEGNWVTSHDKRSQFEAKGQSPYFKGDYAKKTYQTGDYRKKSWWGDKDYGKSQYAGNTDGSRFQKDSRFDGQGAREGGRNADAPDAYQTGDYPTTAAREAGKDNLAKPGNAEIENRRKTYQPPYIIDWREQRSLSIDQSRGLFGH